MIALILKILLGLIVESYWPMYVYHQINFQSICTNPMNESFNLSLQ